MAARGTDGGKKIGDGLALLKICHVNPAPLRRLGVKARLSQERQQLPVHRTMGRGQLQVIAFTGIGDRPPRQKGAPKESGTAMILL